MPKVKTGPLMAHVGAGLSGLTLAESGFLRPGFHDCTLAEARSLVTTTPAREKMWRTLLGFLAWPILTGKFSHVFIDGGFVSLKDEPQDIDVVLQTLDPFGPASFKVLEPFFSMGLETIQDVFSVHLHFWMENAPAGMADFRSFFQYVRPDHPHAVASFPKKGVLRISLLDPDIREQLKEQLEGASDEDDV
jgi:hypothetical protein